MHSGPIQVLQAANRAAPAAPRPRLLIAGATGVLGNEVLRRLAGGGQYEAVQVLAREPIKAGLRGVEVTVVEGESPEAWPVARADTAVVLFEPPRLFYDRERALWTPRPGQLAHLAAWLHECGVTTLAVVLPHAQGRLPEALKRGLAGLDEHAVAALRFKRVLFVRSAQPAAGAPGAGFLPRLAHWMLSIFKYMVPPSEQPVRAVKVAQFVAVALQAAPPGIHVAAPEVVSQAAQGDLPAAVRRWLAG